MISAKTKKIFALLVTAVLAITTMVIPVSAASYTSKNPYVRSWLDAVNDYEVIDYYEYTSGDNAYYKSATINYKGSNAYYKTTDAVLTTSLYDEEIGFDTYGNIWFVTSSNELVYFAKGSKLGSSVSTASELIFDDNGFVIGFTYNNTSYYLDGNSSGNNNNNWNNGNNSNGNNNWSSGNNNNGNNNWNSGNNGNNNFGNTSATYPYLAVEDNKLTYVESSDQHHSLYIEDNYLILNNIILYKNTVKSYGFTKNGVAYINKDNKLVTYEFGAKKQYVIAKNVTSFTGDNGGFITGYVKSDGKTYNI